MNTKYIKMDDKVLVLNEEEKIEKTIPSTDNIEDILNQENKIEEIKKAVETLKIEMPYLQKNLVNAKKNALFSLPIGLLLGLSFGFTFGLSGHGVVLSEAYKKGMLYGSLLCGFGFGLFCSVKEIIHVRNTKKELSNMEIQSFFLEKDLETEKAYLQELNELANKTFQDTKSDIITIDTEVTRQKLNAYRQKLSYYGKRVKEFMNKPLTGNFRNELYRNGIDAETYEDYMEVKSLKK